MGFDLESIQGDSDELARVRLDLRAAVGLLRTALEDHLLAIENERDHRTKYQATLDTAEWSLGEQIHREGNKTFIGTRQVTADEARTWLAHEAQGNDHVAEAREHLQAAEHETETAKNAVEIARQRVSALKHDLDAARVQLEMLTSVYLVTEGNKSNG